MLRLRADVRLEADLDIDASAVMCVVPVVVFVWILSCFVGQEECFASRGTHAPESPLILPEVFHLSVLCKSVVPDTPGHKEYEFGTRAKLVPEFGILDGSQDLEGVWGCRRRIRVFDLARIEELHCLACCFVKPLLLLSKFFVAESIRQQDLTLLAYDIGDHGCGVELLFRHIVVCSQPNMKLLGDERIVRDCIWQWSGLWRACEYVV